MNNDVINHPSHYTDGNIEVWDYIKDKELNYFLGNAIKYISRAGKKNPDKYVEDLKKAIAYLNKEIDNTEYQPKHIESDVCSKYLNINNDIVVSILKDLENRIDKSIELIEKHKEPLHHSFDEPDCDYWIATNPDDLLDILRGEDNETL